MYLTGMIWGFFVLSSSLHWSRSNIYLFFHLQDWRALKKKKKNWKKMSDLLFFVLFIILAFWKWVVKHCIPFLFSCLKYKHKKHQFCFYFRENNASVGHDTNQPSPYFQCLRHPQHTHSLINMHTWTRTHICTHPLSRLVPLSRHIDQEAGTMHLDP